MSLYFNLFILLLKALQIEAKFRVGRVHLQSTMPKKFQGKNTKAASANERKAAKAAEEKEKRDTEAENALWQDDDKNLAKKNMRKEERERKRLEELQRKHEIRLLAKQEEAEEPKAKTRPITATKVTQFQLQQQRLKAEAAAASADTSTPTHLDAPLMENTNRLEDVVSATGVDEALKALSVSSPDPEGGGLGRVNMAAAYRAFEERRLPGIKKENPTLKLSQLKQRLRKEWQKSPDNPLNALQLVS